MDIKNLYVGALIVILFVFVGQLIYSKQQKPPEYHYENTMVIPKNNVSEKPLTVEQKLNALNEENMREQKQIQENLLKSLPETNIKENTKTIKSLNRGNGLLANLFGKKNDAIKVSESERDILARIIAAEAEGEPYEGQVAVGAVVLNRVKSKKFPNTIQEVVFAPGQFEPVSNGRYERVKPGETQYRAADEALSGVDPTNGALYFYAPSLTKQRWHETLTFTVEIGSHRFFK